MLLVIKENTLELIGMCNSAVWLQQGGYEPRRPPDITPAQVGRNRMRGLISSNLVSDNFP